MFVRANIKLVQQHMQNLSGKVVLLKDLPHLTNKLRKQSMSNNLQNVVDQLRGYGDDIIEILVTDDNAFPGLFYQDRYIQQVFEAFPEMNFYATCKLLYLPLAVYIHAGC
jgi:predicted KAP-like P-loop ATPase